jgi:hypothetical protein
VGESDLEDTAGHHIDFLGKYITQGIEHFLAVCVRVGDDTNHMDGTIVEPHIMGREIFMELFDGARVHHRGHGGGGVGWGGGGV